MLRQGTAIERTVYVRSPEKANTIAWKLQKCLYGLEDASRFWYSKLKEEFVKLGALPSTLDKGIFTWTKEHRAISIVTCFVDDVLWG